MPGYSGTPLPKKLGIKEKYRVAFVDLPSEVRNELRAALSSCAEAAMAESVDLPMAFV